MPPKGPQIEIRSRAALRAWLADHHGDAATHWLITWKRPSPHYVPFEALVEELLCWGWVDSVTARVDDTRSAVRISPRKPTSAWSAVNKAHVARARESGAMAPPGEAAIAIAQENGMWSFLDDVDRLEVPPDLAAALDAAGQNGTWDGWPRSVKRGTLEWIKTAKRPATRATRIDDVVSSARDGQRPSPFRR